MSQPPPPQSRPRYVNRPARRAGILLIVLAAGALCMALLATLFIVFLPEMEKAPELADKLNELRQQTPIDLRTVFVATAAMCGVYAIASMVIGIGLLGGRRGWVIAGLVLTIGCTLVMVLNTLSSISMGMGGLLPLMLVAAHGVAAYWLLAGLNGPQRIAAPQWVAAQRGPTPATVTPPNFPVPPQPMQAYYEPPIPLPRREVR